ncbi:MAG: hypothetical protein HYU76_12465 [Betaproteobacteria bacterium]|nr:hypothetical protein [Betaproteobacteria bacterium]
MKRALERLFEQTRASTSVYRASAKFRSSDKTPGDVARHSKRLLEWAHEGSLAVVDVPV